MLNGVNPYPKSPDLDNERKMKMSYAHNQAGKPNEKYRAPHLEGYRWIGNSSKETQEEAVASYRNSYPENKLIAKEFNPEGRTTDDPLWQYTTKWAIYKKVA
jgi:hypothetical protein